MRVVFLYSAKERDETLAAAFQKGVIRCGDQCSIRLLTVPPHDIDADFVCIIGTKNRAWFKYCLGSGQNVLYFDKGFANRTAYVNKTSGMWRVSVNTQQPEEYIATARHNPGRWEKIFGKVKLAPWRTWEKDTHIVVAHSSEKYSLLADIPHPTEWVAGVVEEIRKHSQRRILYRPKPSWKNATDVPGTTFVRDWPLQRVLARAHVLITYGSYVCLDALVSGIPAIILGNAITRSISSTSLSDVENPYLPTEEQTMQVLSNMAWCQYSIEEYQSGFAWKKIQELFLGDYT